MLAHLECGAWETGEPSLAEGRHRSDDLRFLAAHDLGDPRLVRGTNSGNELHLRPVEADLGQCSGNIGGTSGTLQIGGFLPALAAADHPRQQHVVFPASQPRADLFPQRIVNRPS